MKRAREEVCVGSPLRQPQPVVFGRKEGVTQPHMANAGSSSAQKLTTIDALDYLKAVKEMFIDKKEKYDEFLEVMKDFKAQRTDTAGVVARVKELFVGHRDLILGFNTFLPKGSQIVLPEEPPAKKPVEFEQAVNFVNKIKTRFQDDHVYKSFLDILNLYRREQKPVEEIYQRVAMLLRDHQDLLTEFTNFLPHDSKAIFRVPPANGSILPDRGSAMPTFQPVNVDKKGMLAASLAQQHFTADRGSGHDKLLVRSDKLLQRCAERDGDKRQHEEDGQTSDQDMYNQMELAFCEKVKERLQNPDEYQKFLKFLDVYSREIITRKEFKSLVFNVLGKYPDLVEGFDHFLTHCENNNNEDRTNGRLARSVMGESKARLHDRELEDRERQKDCDSREHPGESIVHGASSNKESIGMSIHELDLSDCERCSPSYCLLPEDYPVPITTQRTELGMAVLNDHWVSVTSGSEDYSFKHMRKNQYEESLFRCEDDRFELDMLMESVNGTINRVEEVLEKMNNTLRTNDPIHVEDYFTVLHIRCIERLYGDHGLDAVHVLKKNAALALPVILTRLKQKQEEWARCRANFSKVWAEIYAKNHDKSLDHRSFYFKQQDTKNLSTKALLAEIKEVSEQKLRNDDVLLAVAGESKLSMIPHMEFEYSDPDIFEDLHQLIKHSACREVCTDEQVDKIMKIWSTFVENLFGTPAQPHIEEDSEDAKAEGGSIPDAQAPNCIQLNPSRNVDENLPHRLDSGNSQAKEDESHSATCSTAVGGSLYDQPSSCNVSGSSGPVQVSGTTITENSSGLGTTLSSKCNGTASAHEIADCARPVVPDGVISTSMGEKRHEGSNAHPNAKRKDWKLTPIRVINGGSVSRPYQNKQGVTNEVYMADEGEKSDHRLSEESEFAFANGDILVSESDGTDYGAGSKGEAEAVSDADEEGVASLSFLERSLQTAKPLAKHVTGKARVGRVFYGNDSFYVLFRLHQTLYERIQSAKRNCSSTQRRWRSSNDSDPSNLYSRFMSALYNLLNGSSDNTKFEDDCRAIIGTQSYLLFTLDKLIYKLVKQLQIVATDEVEGDLLQLYAYEDSRLQGRSCDEVYHKNARVLLHDDNIYRIECKSGHPTRLSIRLMENGHDKPEAAAVSVEPKFSAYLHNDLLNVASNKKENTRVFMKRLLPKCSNERQALEGFQVRHALESKISCNTSKVSYVFDTEDVLQRRSRKRTNTEVDSNCREQNRSARRKRLHQLFPST